MRAALGARPRALGQRPIVQQHQARAMQRRVVVVVSRSRGQGVQCWHSSSSPATGPLPHQQPQQQQPHHQQPRLLAAAASSNASTQTRRQRNVRTAAALSSSSGAGANEDDSNNTENKTTQLRLALAALTLSLTALAVGLYYTASAGFTAPASISALKSAVAQSPLGRSGLVPAFSLIFLSEVGDKTFFIAALLAAKLGRAVAFCGSMAALATMTAISVLIGALCSRVPEALRSSLPLGDVAGTLLLVVFGVRALREALKSPEEGPSGVEEELADAREVVEGSVAVDGGGESKAAASTPAAAAAPADKALGARLFEVATLIFLAEWGDRSMLATVALGAAQSPWAVAIGATAGHAAATAIAVVGGALAGSRVSERAINATSGVLFLLFAAATLFTAF
jgi:putative Ca2+/H+ antiporter (TMEM165/GDT1 family)